MTGEVGTRVTGIWGCGDDWKRHNRSWWPETSWCSGEVDVDVSAGKRTGS